jgi:TolB-like protein
MRKIRTWLFLSIFAAALFACISGCASGQRPSPVGGPSAPSSMGKTFAALRGAVDYFDSQGYVIQGRFERSRWPATVVHEKESLNEISFALKSGDPHLYSGYDGYRLKVVALEDAVHDETVLVFRSKDRKVPASGVPPVNQPTLPPGKELDRQLDNLISQINGYLAAQKMTKIAVVEFSNLDGSVSGLGKYLAEELTTRLVRNSKVQIVERKLLNRTLEEQKLSAYGMVDQKTAKAFGLLFGADAILTGTVSMLDASARINARLIDTQTGAVFAAASATVPRGKEVEGLMIK